MDSFVELKVERGERRKVLNFWSNTIDYTIKNKNEYESYDKCKFYLLSYKRFKIENNNMREIEF